MDPAAIKAALKQYALQEAGLDLIGVASAAPFEKERSVLERRKPNPFEFQELAPRVTPEMILPGARSIIAAGISYLAEDEPLPPPEPGRPRGWLSRYCRGLDYHGILKAGLQQVAKWLEENTGARTLVHVDTGPPLDRAVAERAGIGKFGKHTNLITPGFGTWVFLGEILTDLELPPDEPVEAACGTCTLCIDACPTQALTEWHLDADRCLSYVTQMKGVVPPEFREAMGTRLFGCDDCQDVCPFNKKARAGAHPEFAPVPEVGAEPDLLKLMTMTKSDFRRWFEPTAAGWRGKTTIQRNALMAMGNAGDPAALPVLAEALRSESPVIRATAAWALGRLPGLAPEAGAGARAALEARRPAEQDPVPLHEIQSALEVLASV